MSIMSTSDKQATLGGAGENEFEKSFASIAFQHVQEKAPKLLDYMVGFQLVDRNEEDTKAVGVFGFQLDKQMVFVPVFFLSGDLKGHELMYLKNQDMFVPLKENWVNYILRKKPQNLGTGVSQTSQDMGVLQPNVSQVILPPFMSSKYSAYMEAAKSWVRDTGVMETLAKLSFDLDAADDADAYFGGETPEKSSGCLERLLDSDPRYDQALVTLCTAWPGVKEALDHHYGAEFLPTRVQNYQTKRAAARTGSLFEAPARAWQPRKFPGGSLLKWAVADEPASPDVDKTQIITHNSPLLDEDTRSKLLRDGLLIRDARTGDEFTQQYNTQQPMTLSNPDETGVYDVLFSTGEFHKCLVIKAPYSGDGRHAHATVLQLGERGEGGRPVANLPTKQIYVRQNPTTLEETGEWFKDLPDGRGGSGSDGEYIAVSPNGEGTVPFELGDDLGNKARSAYFNCHCAGEQLGGVETSPPSPLNPGPYDGPAVIFDVRRGNRFLAAGRALYIPDGAKLIETAPPRKCQSCSKTRDNCSCGYFQAKSREKVPKIMCGGPADLQLALTKKTAELKIQADHCDMILDGRRLSKKAALISLVAGHGLAEVDARRFLKQAELNDVAKWRIVYAAGYPRSEKRAYGMGGFPEPSEGGSQYGMGQMPAVDPNMGSDMPYVPVNMTGPVEQQMPVPGLEAGMNDPNIYNPMLVQDPLAAQQGAQQAQQAAGQGQKEVFDTSMMSALTKVVNPDNIVDDDLPIYAKALNKLGRRLFMFFWHNESFQERYGKKDLPELEDTLRNAFEMMGDLLLYLKQKSVDTLFGTSMSNIGPNIQDASRT